MPFSSDAYPFDPQTIRTVNEVGAVYGLFRPSTARPGHFLPLYVGEPTICGDV